MITSTYLALWEFHRLHERYPLVRDTTDADEVVALARDINERHAKIKADTGNDSSALSVEQVL
jgi:hypothetical protein